METIKLKNELGKIKYAKLVIGMEEAVLDFILASNQNYDRMCMEMDVDNLEVLMMHIIGDPEEIDYTALEEAYNVVLLYTKKVDTSIDGVFGDIDEDYGGKGRSK